MRIIAGSARGRKLIAPKGRATRPTTDRIRESLFALLGDLDGAVALDAFAGSGALGCEALSRGASFCTFVDPNTHAARAIRSNLAAIDAFARARVLQCTLSRARLLPPPPHLAFLDPPYARLDLEAQALEQLCAPHCLAPDALIILERSSRSAPPALPPRATLEEERAYGETTLFFVRLPRTPAPCSSDMNDA